MVDRFDKAKQKHLLFLLSASVRDQLASFSVGIKCKKVRSVLRYKRVHSQRQRSRDFLLLFWRFVPCSHLCCIEWHTHIMQSQLPVSAITIRQSLTNLRWVSHLSDCFCSYWRTEPSSVSLFLISHLFISSYLRTVPLCLGLHICSQDYSHLHIFHAFDIAFSLTQCFLPLIFCRPCIHAVYFSLLYLCLLSATAVVYYLTFSVCIFLCLYETIVFWELRHITY